MAKHEDWRGEGLIRGSITKQESKSEVRRLVSTAILALIPETKP